jgi:hypothetical protein
MAVAYDAATGGQTAGGVSSLTFSHTTSGSNRALFVGVAGEWFGTTLTGITYSAISMTSLWNAFWDTFYAHAGFRLAGPASGANNVVVSFGAAADVIRVTAVSLTGVDQTTPCGTPVTTTATATSITVDAAAATDDIVVSHLAVMSNIGNNWSPASGTTRATSGSVGSAQSISATYAGASTVTTTWNSDFGANRVALGSVAFKAIATAPILTQSRYRWRNDDGSETGATWAAAENTAITLAQNTPRRLRVQVQSTNDKPSASYKLQYRKVGDPGWDDVT